MELFPNISSSQVPVALWAAPHVFVEGQRLYAVSTTMQFCLYPVDPVRANDVLVRRVTLTRDSTTGEAAAELGPVFWGGPSGSAPGGM
jgi:hypothetical protein